jgi:hypothetical protein
MQDSDSQTMPESDPAALFALIPVSAVEPLLIFAGTDLAISRRLFDSEPSCLAEYRLRRDGRSRQEPPAHE